MSSLVSEFNFDKEAKSDKIIKKIFFFEGGGGGGGGGGCWALNETKTTTDCVK